MQRGRPRQLETSQTVSVVIPCYNYGRFLPAAVRSAVDQGGVDVEVIVVDDCSTDDSRAVAEKLAGEHPNVRVIAHDTNQGHIATYNDGINQATGTYLVLLSADDLLPVGALSRAAALLEAEPTVGLVHGYATSFSGEPPAPRTRVRSWSVWSGAAWIERTCRRGAGMLVSPEAMIRRQLLGEIGGFDDQHPHAADMLLWLRAAARADVGRVNGVDQAFYRLHDSNMHSTTFKGIHRDTVERVRVFDELFRDDLRSWPSTPALRATAVRAVAVELLHCARLAAAAGGTYDGTAGEEYAALALECDPSVARTRLWRKATARAATGTSWIERRTVPAAHALRWKVRWRRWRRFGT